MEFIIYVIIGALTGIFAGLLGIGGGMIVVPALALLFEHFHIGAHYNVQFASGTSLAIMIFTSLATIYRNHQLKRIYYPALKQTIGWVLVTIILGAVVARFLHGDIIAVIFAGMLLILLIKMLKQDSYHKYNAETLASNISVHIPRKKAFYYGCIIGLKSGLLGIGGGAIAIPYLTRYKVPIKIACATTSAMTLPIAVVGCICYMITGLTGGMHQSMSTGYIYWPAVVLIAPASMIASKFGTKLASILSPKSIRLIFILLFSILIIKLCTYAFDLL